jgi:hypothetical protein
MSQEQILNFKPVSRREQVGDKRRKQMKDCKHHVE